MTAYTVHDLVHINVHMYMYIHHMCNVSYTNQWIGAHLEHTHVHIEGKKPNHSPTVYSTPQHKNTALGGSSRSCCGVLHKCTKVSDLFFSLITCMFQVSCSPLYQCLEMSNVLLSGFLQNLKIPSRKSLSLNWSCVQSCHSLQCK